MVNNYFKQKLSNSYNNHISSSIKELDKKEVSDTKININFKKLGINKKLDYPFYINNQDRGISTELFTWHFREPIYTKMLYNFINKNNNIDIIIDIGSNIGYFNFIERLATDKKIISIEPVINSFKLLFKNVESLNNIILLNKAVSNKKEKLCINIPERSNLAKILTKNNKLNPAFEYDNQIVQGISLQNIIDKYNLKSKNIMLRLDVEGYEEKIFRNLPKQITSISYELHPRYIGDILPINILLKLLSENFKIHSACETIRYMNLLVKYLGLNVTLNIYSKMLSRPLIYEQPNFIDIKKLILSGQCTHIFLTKN